MASLPLWQGDGSANAINWTALAATLSLRFVFQNAPNPVIATPLSANLDPTLWPLVFPDTLVLGAFSTGAAQTTAVLPTQSYSVNAAVQTVYNGIHTPPVYNGGGGRRPVLEVVRLSHLVPDTPEEQEAVRRHAQYIRSTRGSQAHAHFARGSGGFSSDMLHFADMNNFYGGLAQGAQQRYAAATNGGTSAPATLVPPQLDFHDALTALSRYPSLMRALGLLLDFELDMTGMLNSLATPGTLSVAPADPTPFAGWTLVQPTTQYALDVPDQGFYLSAAGQIPELAQGYFGIPPNPTVYSLRLDALAHNLYNQVVVAKARLQAQSRAREQVTVGDPFSGESRAPQNRRRAAVQATTDAQPEDTGAAVDPGTLAPTSSGLTLALSDANSLIGTLEAMLVAQATAATSATPGAPALTAESLVRGFRVDVQRSTDTSWYSLHARSGTYTFPGGRSESWADEGWLSLNAFNPSPDTPGAPLWAHENLFLWQGWSLSAPRPGQISNAEGQLMPQTDPSITGTNLDVNIDFAPTPGTLLPLRFGTTYNCRLRAVDLAGFSLPLATPTLAGTTASLGTFLRHDPAPPPVLLTRDAFGPGESMTIVAIRSDVSAPAASNAGRLIVPPAASLQLAEWHGALDVNNVPNPQLFADPTFPPRLTGTLPAAPYGANPPAVPYLPDPAVVGVILDLDPATTTPDTTPVTVLPFDGTWPAWNTWQLLLEEGPQAVVLDPAIHTVTVTLPKAGVLSLNLAAALADQPADGTPGGIGLFDYWNAAQTGQLSGTTMPAVTALHAAILNGRVNQMTPPAQVDLVHAVQRPLIASTFLAGATVGRGSTNALLAASASVDGASTGKAELRASWSEWFDDGINPPSQTSFQAVAASTTILPTDTTWSSDPGLAGVQIQNLMQQEFNDTRARQITYTIMTTTRFLEFFPSDITSDPANVTQTGPAITLNIPCSTNPPAPKVLYVIPALQFQTSTDDSGNPVHTRTTRLRVYLDRPWYASGDGEQLGVVLPAALPPSTSGNGNGIGNGNGNGNGNGPVRTIMHPLDETDPLPVSQPASPTSIPPLAAPFVTQWGSDPATLSGGLPVPLAPLPSQLPGGTLVESEWFSFPQNPTGLGAISNAVVAYDVQFEPPDPANPTAPANPARTPNNGRWFADIELDTGGAACPFVRLALTRYQGYNTVNAFCSCSSVILADFVQLSPTRTASLGFDPNAPTLINVAVQGFGTFYFQDPNNDPNRYRQGTTVMAHVEVDYGEDGNELWIMDSAGATYLPWNSPDIWTGSITLPFARGTRAMRLVLREFENWSADPADRNTGETPVPYERLVYADCFAI
jgi:hypothetical protein